MSFDTDMQGETPRTTLDDMQGYEDVQCFDVQCAACGYIWDGYAQCPCWQTLPLTFTDEVVDAVEDAAEDAAEDDAADDGRVYIDVEDADPEFEAAYLAAQLAARQEALAADLAHRIYFSADSDSEGEIE